MLLCGWSMGGGGVGGSGGGVVAGQTRKAGREQVGEDVSAQSRK